jgi:predicted metal-binding membrane protein
MTSVAGRNGFLTLIGLLVVCAWAALWAWSQSPYGRFFDHSGWVENPAVADLCRALPGGEVIVPAVLHGGAWVLMIAAMMVPTTVPLLEILCRLTALRRDRRLLLALVIGGYLAVWAGFGVAAHGLDRTLHAAVAAAPGMAAEGWLVGAGLFAVAGAFQFSPWKYRCLDRCRTPLSFVVEHWRGRRQRWTAFVLGVRHGAFCVGCCWALMLLMFAVGTGSIGWMLLLGAVMAAEKNLPWGRRLSLPVGVALLVAAAAIVGVHMGAEG